MKLQVIGWTFYDDERYPARRSYGASAERAVIEALQKRGYRFGGSSHQHRRGCTPVLNDGTRLCYSQRAWGSVMAKALGVDDTNGKAYMEWYVDGRNKQNLESIYPKQVVSKRRIVPLELLAETHEMHLADDPFFAIKDGSKTVEVRLFDEKRQHLDEGDLIVFRRENSDERVLTRVLRLETFPDFRSLYEAYPAFRFGVSDEMTSEELTEEIYRYYSKEAEKEYGVLAIEIVLVGDGSVEKSI